MFYNSIKIMLCIVVTFIPLLAENTEKKMSINSAKITYDISGGGQLTPENNLSIKGTEKLTMKNQGKIQFHTLELTESIEGNIKDIAIAKYMHKHVDMTMFNVDFDQQIIIENMNSVPDNMIDLRSLEQNGTDVIGNYTCDIWKNSTQKVCLYHNVPLLIEKHYLGFTYRKKAKFVLFDINISDEFFALPDFPIEENALLQNDIKTTNLHDSSYFYEKILNGTDINLSKKLLYLFTDDMVKRQKENLPTMLQYMKEARECLSLASDHKNANICMGDLSVLTKNLTNSADLNIGIWTKETQNRIMDYLEENILKLQATIPCIKRAHNIDDLSACMRN